MILLFISKILSANLANSLFAVINQRRREENMPALRSINNLESSAKDQALYMCENSTLTHNNPSGDLQQRVKRNGFFGQLIGENIAKNHSERIEEVANMWMQSPQHKKNILGEYSYTGLATCLDKKGSRFWVQVFGSDLKPEDKKGDPDSSRDKKGYPESIVDKAKDKKKYNDDSRDYNDGPNEIDPDNGGVSLDEDSDIKQKSENDANSKKRVDKKDAGFNSKESKPIRPKDKKGREKNKYNDDIKDEREISDERDRTRNSRQEPPSTYGKGDRRQNENRFDSTETERPNKTREARRPSRNERRQPKRPKFGFSDDEMPAMHDLFTRSMDSLTSLFPLYAVSSDSQNSPRSSEISQFMKGPPTISTQIIYIFTNTDTFSSSSASKSMSKPVTVTSIVSSSLETKIPTTVTITKKVTETISETSTSIIEITPASTIEKISLTSTSRLSQTPGVFISTSTSTTTITVTRTVETSPAPKSRHSRRRRTQNTVTEEQESESDEEEEPLSVEEADPDPEPELEQELSEAVEEIMVEDTQPVESSLKPKRRTVKQIKNKSKSPTLSTVATAMPVHRNIATSHRKMNIENLLNSGFDISINVLPKVKANTKKLSNLQSKADTKRGSPDSSKRRRRRKSGR